MSWPNRFVGLSHEAGGRVRAGCDCYGLARVIYQEELGLSLPDYLGALSIEEEGEIAALIAGRARLPMWVPIDGPAVAFDLAVFRRGRMQTHLGVVVRRGLMLHMVEGDCAKLEPYHTGRWAARLTGHWRHIDLIGAAAR